MNAPDLIRDEPALSDSEQLEFEDCERIIAYGIEMFLSACRALKTIREKKLYRVQYPSWQSYVTDRWASLFTDSGTADRWINIAVVNENLTPVGVTVEHDRHARELSKYQGVIQQAVALVGVRAAELESQTLKRNKPVTESHFKQAGALLTEMVTTGAIDMGVEDQHPIIEALAVSVVERRRRSVLDHLTPREPVYDGIVQVVATPEYPFGALVVAGQAKLRPGSNYVVKVFELGET